MNKCYFCGSTKMEVEFEGKCWKQYRCLQCDPHAEPKPMTTLADELNNAMKENGETLSDLVASTLSEDDMKNDNHERFLFNQNEPFRAWSKNYVYFPVHDYDYNAWDILSVKRNPSSS